jgi:CRP-like cAMP-binding protein
MATLARDLIVSAELKDQLERLATSVSKPKGAVLFRRGAAAAGVFLIRRGKVSLGLDCNTPTYPTRILGPDSVVGLPATVAGAPYSLTAEVVEDAQLGFVPRSAVMDCLRSHPQLCFQVMDMLSGEIAEIRSAVKAADSKRTGRRVS